MQTDGFIRVGGLLIFWFFCRRHLLGGAPCAQERVARAFECGLDLGRGEAGAARLAALPDLLDSLAFFEVHEASV